MKQRLLPSFVEQRARYALRFTCEDCSYFDGGAQRCTHGYPSADHRAARYDRGAEELVFCKEFELK